MLLTRKFTPVMLFWCSANTQSFDHDKSNSISQFISGISRNLQKIPRHLSGIATSTFKTSTAGPGGHGDCGGCGGICGVLPTIFVC